LAVVAPQDGYKHLALTGSGNPQDPAVAGINEKGLVVVDALAGSLTEEAEVCGAPPLTQTLLSRCASVDEVLAQKALLRASYPVFEMVADREQAAWIEVAPGGLVSVKVVKNGALGHTNHYLDPLLAWGNQTAGRSSRTRQRRIEELLSAANGPLTFADFLAFSQDRHAGPDRSLNRLGGKPGKTRTLATFVAWLSEGAPQVFVRLTNPGQPEKIVNLRLEPDLWEKGLREKIL
jgi:hypothetical protein